MNNKNIWIITYCDIHSHACAIILKKFLNYVPVNLVITNYHKSKDYLHNIENDDTVYILNFSLPINVMKSLDKRCDLFWIDHHLTPIEKSMSDDFNPKGWRSTERLSLELVWKFCFKTDPLPIVLELILDYERFEFRMEDTLAFRMAIQNIDVRPYDSKHKLWENLLEITKSDNEYESRTKTALDYFKSILGRGKEIKLFNSILNEYCSGAFPFKTKINGIDVIAMNAKTGNSFIFNNIPTEVKQSIKALVTFAFVGNIKKWRFSIYESFRGSCDVGKIASSLGGGGGKGVAGFALKNLPLGFIPIKADVSKIPTMEKVYNFLKRSPSSNHAFIKSQNISIKTVATDAVIEDRVAILCNTLHTTTDMLLDYDVTGYQIFIQYALCKNLLWRVTIHKCVMDVNLDKIKDKYKTEYNEDGSLTFFIKNPKWLKGNL